MTYSKPYESSIVSDLEILASRVSLTPPFDDPVLVFGLAVVVFLVAPLLLQRYRLPGIVGIILVGAAIGPNGLGLLERGETIQLLGEVGLIYLLFLAGLEIDIAQFVAYKDRSIVFGLLSFVIPQAVGMAVGVALLELTLPAAALFAAIFASHTLLAYPIVTRLGIVTNEAMTATIGGTILTDTLALLVLAIVIAATEGTLDAVFWTRLAVGLAVFFVGVWLLVPRLGRWFFRRHHEESYVEYLFVLAVLFTCAFLAELVGVEHIIGAFLAGLTLNRLVPETGTLMNRIEFVGNALFIPFFLLSVGMLVDARVVLEGTETLVLATALLVMVVATKYVAAWVTGRMYGYSHEEVAGMFGLSVGQAAAALAIVQIGFDAGVPGFGQHMLNAVVVMILVVSVLSPIAVERAGAGIVRARAQAPYDLAETTQRLLVPVSRNSCHAESLLDLAVTIRDPRDDESIHTLSVVQPDGIAQTEANVVDARARLEELSAYAASAEVSVLPHTRVNHNVASEIVNATIEHRITTLVIGWDGARSRTQAVYGHVIDQVLDRTTQLALVGRVREPLNTTGRILLVVPHGVEHNDGVDEAGHTIGLVADGVDAPIEALVVGASDSIDQHHENWIEAAVPDGTTSVETVPDWEALEDRLEAASRADDLVVCLSSRRGDIGWQPDLQTVPSRIARRADGNFVVVYPATDAKPDDRQFFRFT
ncbi:cation:proton antiporter [Salinadaptatus halalkaliphilus]|uniref:Cation:proton antiporter n=1 Tax=Salinadaptatus halalkaliphilus TaxID=2419781 RepID=A0A4V3VKW3_9EURY|nr:cation:proton antiporter [Salinadaptatus halalkaliphilus]THE63307.1 cation:proton antiporter [Salinadaptatus halalkaliphilus]